MMKQYRYQCCGYIVSERFEDSHCRQCGRLSPILEEVDKEDLVYLLPETGHSGDDAEETREWGNFKILLDEPNVKIKKITVNPNSRLSLQLHRYRSEWWKIIKGQGLMQVGATEWIVEEGDTVNIVRLEVHRIANEADSPLIFVEVQSGECQENDIIRIEDDYGRA
jgi:mannose-6-phosphate isomerase